jgi:hypothetical protein
MAEAKNELRGQVARAAADTVEESGEHFRIDHSAAEMGSQPISLAYWIEGGADLAPISGHTAKKSLGHLSELQPFATSTTGERVALYTIFPSLQALGRLMPGHDYYSIMSTTNARAEKCYNPVRLLMFIVPDDSGVERQLLVVAEVRREREFLIRRLDLLAGKAGAVWHYTANQGTAGLGFLGFAEASLGDVLDGSRSLSADTLTAVRGGGRALKGTQENIRVLCALARCNDGAREIGLKDGIDIFSRFARGMYAPDMRVEVKQINEEDTDGVQEASGPNLRQAGQVLLPETSLLHLIFELMHVVYLRGGREITWQVLSNREVKLEVGFDISWPEEIGFLIAVAVGRAYGIGVESLGKRSLRCVVW